MNVAGIEIIITVVIALALSCVGFVVHGKLLQREVRRALEARRLRLTAELPVAAAPRPAPSYRWEAQTLTRLRGSEPHDDEIAAMIAESEAIAARVAESEERGAQRQLSGSRAS